MLAFPKSPVFPPLFSHKKKLFIYFWLHWVFVTVHRLSLVAESASYSLVAVCGLLITAASPVAEHRPEVQRLHGGSTQPQQLWLWALAHRLSSCGIWV